MRPSLFLVLSFISTSVAQATDLFNTYQWNRHNVAARNGRIDRGPWFEWWYYKVVLPETGESFFAVYGVVNPWDTEGTLGGTRANVGFGDFSNNITLEEKLSVGAFSAAYDRVEVRAGEGNLATDKSFRGAIRDEKGHSASWNVNIERRWAFNAVSWVTGKGITNIEWYPAQGDARCTGNIVSHGELHEFVDAPCYQDRNWGRSFPEWWAWIVSNSFEGHPDSVLVSGGGKPKMLGVDTPVQGMAIGLRHDGKEYAFRPNDLARVEVNINFGTWEVQGETAWNRIEISARAPKEKFIDLRFATPQGELFHDYEALDGDVEVRLFRRSGLLGLQWEPIDTLVSHFAGIEYGSRKDYSLTEIFGSSVHLQGMSE